MRTPGGFEGRRIQKTGGSTFIVSLPKTWVATRGLGAGDLILFSPRPDGTLTLTTQEGLRPEGIHRQVQVTNDEDRDHLFRLLVAEYIGGASHLDIRTPGRMSSSTREVLREFAQQVIGPEILEESADRVVLQDVVGTNPLPLPSVVRRMHQMARAMHTDAMTAFAERDPAIAKDVQQRDWEVDRLHWFVQKQVNMALKDQRHLTTLDLTLPECVTYLLSSRHLERIADHAVRIAQVTDLVKGTPFPRGQVEDLSRLSQAALDLLDRSVETLFTGDSRQANQVLDSVGKLVADRRKLLDDIQSRPGKVAIALAYVLESLERTALYSGDLAEIAINHAIERQIGAQGPLTPAAKDPSA